MSASPAYPLRETVKCRKCKLNQFMTASAKCRKCHCGLTPELEPEPPKLAIVPKPTPARMIPVANISARLPWAIIILRTRLHITVRELAKRMFVPRQYICKLESGKALPQLKYIPRLAAALEVTPYQLIDLATTT